MGKKSLNEKVLYINHDNRHERSEKCGKTAEKKVAQLYLCMGNQYTICRAWHGKHDIHTQICFSSNLIDVQAIEQFVAKLSSFYEIGKTEICQYVMYIFKQHKVVKNLEMQIKLVKSGRVRLVAAQEFKAHFKDDKAEHKYEGIDQRAEDIRKDVCNTLKKSLNQS